MLLIVCLSSSLFILQLSSYLATLLFTCNFHLFMQHSSFFINLKYSFSTYFYPSLVISNSLTYFNLFLLISTNFYLIILIFTCFYLFALIFTVSNHILLKLRLGFSCLHLGSLHPKILSENSVFII